MYTFSIGKGVFGSKVFAMRRCTIWHQGICWAGALPSLRIHRL